MPIEHQMPIELTAEILDSISRLVEYSNVDEENDFAEMLSSGDVIEDDENHIYTHIRRIEDWLEGNRVE